MSIETDRPAMTRPMSDAFREYLMALTHPTYDDHDDQEADHA
ncbi:hypothetical protein [Corynebacterium variabile]